MDQATHERRRHERFPLGLPVRVHLEEREQAMLVELLDVSKSGARFGALIGDVRLEDHVAFGFVMPDRPNCHAKGQVVRVDDSGQFVLALEAANDEFVSFVQLLETQIHSLGHSL